MSLGFKRALGALLVVALLEALVLKVLPRLERVRERVYVGPGRAVLENPYYAAGLLVRELGREVHVSAELDPVALPPDDATLLLLGSRLSVGEQRTTRLLEWVDRGGELVVVAPDPIDTFDGERSIYDPLLSRLGVARWTPPAPEEDADGVPAAEAETPPASETGASDVGTGEDEDEELNDVRLSEDGPTLQVTLPADLVSTSDETHWWTGLEDAACLLHFPRGQGGVTVLSDGSPLTTGALSSHDNARLLWYLTRWGDRLGPVWIVYGGGRPSLLGVVWSEGWRVLAVAAVLLALGLVRGARRFGPFAASERPVRRSLEEHVVATGRFLWRHARGGPLLAACRGAVHHAASRRTPDWEALGPPARTERLAQLTGLEPVAIRHALDERPPRGAHDLLVRTRALARMIHLASHHSPPERTGANP